ncbi:MAG TPA: von Willebrand factor type A domain-containing protein [Micromonosporaceae bacterium]|jgi:Ca-activated chloride channel family protein
MGHREGGSVRAAAIAGVLAGALALLLVAGCSASSKSNNTGAPYQPAPNGNANPNPANPQANADGGEGRTAVEPNVDAAQQPESTFAIDIDTASYNYARRQILDGNRVDPQTVRPEEFINAFQQDYPQPPGDGFTITMDGAWSPSATAQDSGEHLLRVGLQTRAEDPALRQPAALTFVVDVSGSMAEPGRLDLVKDALHYLIDQLRESDYVAIVAYDTKAKVLRAMTPVSNRSTLHAAVDALNAGGNTNLEAGVVTGYRVARDGFVPGASNRVILLSDGLANVGDTQAEPILDQIREEAGKQISLLGVGVGSEYGDALMERLADEGDGFVTYVSERDQARKLFVERLPATLAVRAQDAKVQVSFDPSAVDTYRLVGYDDRVLASNDFRNDQVDGGEVGPGTPSPRSMWST